MLKHRPRELDAPRSQEMKPEGRLLKPTEYVAQGL